MLDDSRSDESQASQLLRAVLPSPLPTTPKKPSRNTVDCGEGDSHDAEISSSSGMMPVDSDYCLQGLVISRSDLQVGCQPNGEDSQKEDNSASKQKGTLTAGSPASRSVPPNVSEAIDVGTQDVTSRVPLKRPVASGSKSSKAVSFISPVPSPHTMSHRGSNVPRSSTFSVRGTPRFQRQRSPSPASQDSFAGSLPLEVQEKLFMQNTKVFNLPLSELMRTSTNAPDTHSADTSSSSRRSDTSGYPVQKRRVALPSSDQPPLRGEVLFAATPSDPSHSGQSQIESNQPHYEPDPESQGSRADDGDTQLSDLSAQGQAQPRDVDDDYDRGIRLVGSVPRDDGTMPSSYVDDASTEPSSSYERLLNMDLFEPNPEPLVATQPATQSDESQPAANMADNADAASSTTTPNNDRPPRTYIDRQYPVAMIPSQGISTTTTTTTVSKGLMNLIPAHKRWRYQVAESDAPAAHRDGLDRPDIQVASGPSLPHACPQGTQPSDTYAVDGSASTSVDRDGSRPAHSVRRPVSNSGPSKETDIVPDSEPIEVDVPSVIQPATPLPVGKTRSSRTVTSRRVPDLSSEEVVPESVITEAGEGGDGTDEEEDIPLAAAQLGLRRRGERGVAAAVPNPQVEQDSRKRPANMKGRERLLPPEVAVGDKAVPRTANGVVPRGQPRDVSVVPSSRPLQDALEPVAPNVVHPGSSKERSKNTRPNAAVTKRETTSRAVTPAAARKVQKVQKASKNASSDDETVVSKDGNASMLNEEGEARTELADDEYMDVDEDVVPTGRPRTRKRKRAVSSSKLPPSKGSTRASRSSGTPLAQTSKKMRMASSVVKEGESAPTRVYALWKQDGYYYPGTVHSLVSASPTRYLIHFDDGTEDVVDISKMRLCQLNIGDHVLLLPNNQKAKICDNAHCHIDRYVTVEVDSGDDLVPIDIDIKDVRIASRTLVSAWKDRTISPDDVVPAVRPKVLKNTPSPSKLIVSSTGSVNASRRLLTKTGFVVTLSPGNESWVEDKGRLMLAIKNYGGMVIDDWLDIFTMEGTHSQGNKRWVIHSKDVTLVQRHSIERVFLLSDDANQKPKFLMALALGIPCLETRWLQHIEDPEFRDEWHRFLLPAGFCAPLSARVSQMIDMDWGNCIEHLSEIMSNPVASKLFAEKSILCVAPEFVPLLRKRQDATT